MNEQPDTELWEPVKTNLLKRKEIANVKKN